MRLPVTVTSLMSDVDEGGALCASATVLNAVSVAAAATMRTAILR
jgi:hypothetical protein